MTKDEALKLGIESLEWHNQHMHRKISEQAIAAMKKALAQPEQDWIERERAFGYREGHQNALKQMAQPEQKPVAWMYEVNNAHTCLDLFEPPDDAYDEGTLHPLYTTPPQRKPLTDEEIGSCIDEVNLTSQYGHHHFGWHKQFAKAIEAAHGIKGEA